MLRNTHLHWADLSMLLRSTLQGYFTPVPSYISQNNSWSAVGAQPQSELLSAEHSPSSKTEAGAWLSNNIDHSEFYFVHSSFQKVKAAIILTVTKPTNLIHWNVFGGGK